METINVNDDSVVMINFNTFNILRESVNCRGFKITPQILKKLKNSSIEKVLPKGVAEKRLKRRLTEQNLKKKLTQSCSICGCNRLRVVSPGRLDGECVLECMRRSCLNTIGFTNLPVGGVVSPGLITDLQYFDDPLKIYYPPLCEVNMCKQSSKEEITTNHYESHMMISVPGQSTKAKFI